MTAWTRLRMATPLKVAMGLLAAALMATAGYGLVRAADDSSTIHGCVTRSGSLRIVEDGDACRSGESPISWSSEGAAGPAGPAGADGADGEDGADGAPGRDGRDGRDGEVTVNVTGGGDEFDAPTMYLRVVGQTQGNIQGSSSKVGREDWIEVYGFSHEVVSPRDSASGLPTGKRQHKPITITKPIDKATPLLMNALYRNENLSTFELQFFRTNRATGAEEHYYTIELTNASVSGASRGDSPGTSSPAVDEFTFTYQRIVETWEDGGTTAEDDWEAPAV